MKNKVTIFTARSCQIACFALFELIILVLFWKTGNLGFETNDDWMINAYSTGIFGYYSAFNYCNNIIYGFLISRLYSLLPVINWMTLFYIGTIFVSYVALYAILSRRSSDKLIPLLTSLIYTVITAPYLYMRMNFTKIACVAVITGIILIVNCVEEEKTRWLQLILANILILYGFMLRFKAGVMTFPFFLCFLLLWIKKTEKIKKALMYFGTSVLLIIVIYIANATAYGQNDSWDYFAENVKYYSKIMDYHILSGKEDTIDYDEAELTAEDIAFYSKWNLGDTKVFNNKKLSNLMKYEDKKTINLGYLKKLIADTFTRWGEFNFFYLSLALLFICVIRPGCLTGICAFVFMGGEIFWLSFRGRTPERVAIVPCLCGLVIASYVINSFAEDENLFASLKNTLTISLCMLLTVALLSGEYFSMTNNSGNIRDISLYENFFSQMDQDNNYFILTVGSELDTYYSALDAPEFGTFRNTVYDSDFLACTPNNLKLINDLGDYESIYDALLKRDDMFLVDEAFLVEKLAFIRRNYADVDYSQYCSVNGIDAYAFTLKPEVVKKADVGAVKEILATRSVEYSDLYTITGNLEGLADYDAVYLVLNDDAGQEYYYQIKVENGQFKVGIPVETWYESSVVSYTLAIKQGETTLLDDEASILFENDMQETLAYGERVSCYN